MIKCIQTCTVEDTLVNEASFFPSRLAATDSQSFSAISSACKCHKESHKQGLIKKITLKQKEVLDGKTYHILGHESILQSLQSWFKVCLLQICLPCNTEPKESAKTSIQVSINFNDTEMESNFNSKYSHIPSKSRVKCLLIY